MSQVCCCGKWLSERSCEPACQSGGSLDANLLAENGSRRQLECIPAARHSQARVGLNPLSQQGVSSQGSYDDRPICVQVKHCADSLDNDEERARIAKLNAHAERVIPLVE